MMGASLSPSPSKSVWSPAAPAMRSRLELVPARFDCLSSLPADSTCYLRHHSASRGSHRPIIWCGESDLLLAFGGGTTSKLEALDKTT